MEHHVTATVSVAQNNANPYDPPPRPLPDEVFGPGQRALREQLRAQRTSGGNWGPGL